MERTTLNLPTNVVERNLLLTGELMKYLIESPHILTTLPNYFEVIILPDDDPELRLYNLELLDKYSVEGKSIVFVRMHISSEKAVYQHKEVNLYAPVV